MEEGSTWALHDLIHAIRGLLDHATSVRFAAIESLLRLGPTARPLAVTPEAVAERFLGGTLAECGDLARLLLAHRSEAVDGILVRWLLLPGRHSEAEAVARVLLRGDAADLVGRALGDPSCHENRRKVFRAVLDAGQGAPRP